MTKYMCPCRCAPRKAPFIRSRKRTRRNRRTSRVRLSGADVDAETCRYGEHEYLSSCTRITVGRDDRAVHDRDAAIDPHFKLAEFRVTRLRRRMRGEPINVLLFVQEMIRGNHVNELRREHTVERGRIFGV